MMWKALYGKSAGDHGTLAFFRNQLRRTAVTSDPKKDVDACVDLILTVLKGHILQAACDVLKVDSLESQLTIPAGLQKATKVEKLSFISDIAQEVVERCTLVEEAFFGGDITDTGDGVYNYTRVFCHFAAILMEYRDGWGEGDGERGRRVWKLVMPHFRAAGHTKYALQALRLQIQLATLSPNLAHQVQWNRSEHPRWSWTQHPMRPSQRTRQQAGETLHPKHGPKFDGDSTAESGSKCDCAECFRAEV